MKYEISEKTKQQIQDVFGGEPERATDEQVDRAGTLFEKAEELALLIAGETKPGREQALALTNLEQAILWASAAISREP